MDLLSDDEKDGAEGEEEEEKLRINSSYAARFENRKKKQEMAKLKQLYGGDDSDEESEDDEAELLTPALDLQILDTIAKIRNKRPEVYEPGKQWFEEGEEGGDNKGSDEDDEGEEVEQVRAKPIMTYKQQLLQTGGAASDEDEASQDGGDDEEDDGSGARRKVAKFGYDEEQRQLRAAFLQTADDPADAPSRACGREASGAAEAAGDPGLLVKKQRSQAEEAADATAYSEWLRQQLQRKGSVDEGVTLRRYMVDENLDQDEAFLRDYMLNALWKRKPEEPEPSPAAKGGKRDKAKGSGQGDGEEDAGGEGDGDEEDEEGDFSDREDDFERQFNFRFEEPGATNVMGHARQQDGSVRREAKLGRKRELAGQKLERKSAARERKESELRRLKNLKKQEVLERLKAVQQTSGSAVPFSEVDLSGDFDPEAWDKRMAEVFNDDYYAQYDEDLAKQDLDGEGEGWDAEAWGEDGWGTEAWAGEGGVAGGGGVAREKRRRGKKKRGEGGEGALGAEASLEQLAGELGKAADPSVRRTTQQYMDEYYGLDYEDLIANEIPTRFKYHQVEPTGFGISDAELLETNERTLNKRVPIRYIKRPYGKYDSSKLKRRAHKLKWEDLREERGKLHRPTEGKRPGKGARKGSERASARDEGTSAPAAPAAETGLEPERTKSKKGAKRIPKARLDAFSTLKKKGAGGIKKKKT